MNVIVDANIILAVLLNEPEKERIVDLTKSAYLISPEILPFEIGNALSAMFKKNRLTRDQIMECYKIFIKIPIRLSETDINNALEISCDYNIYAYDAYYLEAAKKTGLKIMTLDQKMIEIAKKLNISLLEVL